MIEYDYSLGSERIKGKRNHSPTENVARSPSTSLEPNIVCRRSDVSEAFTIEDEQFLMFTRSSEDALREIFARFGIVQTCIVNVDKRHAFVKMLTRVDAKRARDGMEVFKSPDMQLRVS